jgi:hypothetical protein
MLDAGARESIFPLNQIGEAPIAEPPDVDRPRKRHTFIGDPPVERHSRNVVSGQNVAGWKKALAGEPVGRPVGGNHEVAPLLSGNARMLAPRPHFHRTTSGIFVGGPMFRLRRRAPLEVFLLIL